MTPKNKNKFRISIFSTLIFTTCVACYFAGIKTKQSVEVSRRKTLHEEFVECAKYWETQSKEFTSSCRDAVEGCTLVHSVITEQNSGEPALEVTLATKQALTKDDLKRVREIACRMQPKLSPKDVVVSRLPLKF